MKKRRFNSIAVLLVFCALSAAMVAPCAAARPTDFADFLPETTLAYVSWDLTGDALKNYDCSRFAKFLADKKVKKLLGEAPLKDIQRVGLSPEEIRTLSRARLAFALIKSELKRLDSEDGIETAVRHQVLLIDISESGPRAVAKKIMTLIRRDARDAGLSGKTLVLHEIEMSIFKIPGKSHVGRVFFTCKDVCVFASTTEAAAAVAGAMKGGLAKPLSKNANYLTAKKKSARAFLWGYVSIAQALRNAGKSASPSSPFGSVSDFVAKQTGLDKVHTLGFSVEAGPGGLMINIHLLGLKADSPIMKVMPKIPGGFRSLALLPKDAESFVAVSISGTEFLDIADKILGNDSIKAQTNDPLGKLAEKEKRGGFDIRKDYLPNLGGEMLVFVPAGFEEVVTATRLKDGAKVEKIALCLFGKDGEKPRKVEYKNAVIHAFSENNFSCTGEYLLVSTDIDALKAAIDLARCKKNLLRETDEYKKARSLFGSEVVLIARMQLRDLGDYLVGVLDKSATRKTGDDSAQDKDAKKADGPAAIRQKLQEAFGEFSRHFKFVYFAVTRNDDGVSLRVLIR